MEFFEQVEALELQPRESAPPRAPGASQVPAVVVEQVASIVACAHQDALRPPVVANLSQDGVVTAGLANIKPAQEAAATVEPFGGEVEALAGKTADVACAAVAHAHSLAGERNVAEPEGSACDASASGEVSSGASHATTGPGLTACWRRMLAARSAAMQIDRDCRADTAAHFGPGFGVADSPSAETLRAGILDALIAKASLDFAVPGVRIDIDRTSLVEALTTKANHHPERYDESMFLYNRPEARRKNHKSREEIEVCLNDDFDPDAIWAYLENHYGGAAGERQALQKVAKAIFSELSLDRKPPEIQKGRLLVRAYASVDKGHDGKKREYSYHTREALGKLRRDLAVFAHWAEDAHTASLLKHAKVGEVDNWGDDVVSRTKVNFGNVEWTLFHTNVEIRFTPDLGVKFRQFIVEYGPRPDPSSRN